MKQHSTDKRKTQTILNKLHRHARDNCANHIGKDGCIQTVHKRCVYSFQCDRVIGNVCPYFMKAVIPSDPILFDQYLKYFPDNYPLKPKKDERIKTHDCRECGKPFIKNSNRQVYCNPCGIARRKKQATARKQKQRNKP